MGCQFCGHSTPHGCWDANEAANCGNYAARRGGIDSRADAVAEVEKIIEARPKTPSLEEIERAEREQLARLKAKYEPS